MTERRGLTTIQAALIVAPPALVPFGFILLAPFDDPDRLALWVQWVDRWPIKLLFLGFVFAWPIVMLRLFRHRKPTTA